MSLFESCTVPFNDSSEVGTHQSAGQTFAQEIAKRGGWIAFRMSIITEDGLPAVILFAELPDETTLS